MNAFIVKIFCLYSLAFQIQNAFGINNHVSGTTKLRGSGNHRRLASVNKITSSESFFSTTSNVKSSYRSTRLPYFITDDLGNRNYDVTLGNPMKGLARNPNQAGFLNTGVEASLDSFYMRFDQIVRGPGIYNWTALETQLNESVSMNSHIIPRFYIAYPGEVVALPPYLIDRVEMRQYTDSGVVQYTPYFGDALLLEAIRDFIKAFGSKYDGDKRIAFIQAGLLGFWGEWHCSGNTEFLPESAKDQVVGWFDSSFNKTHIQIRNARPSSKVAKMGYHDDSFTFATLDGPANGGVYKQFFFWNRIKAASEQDFWQHAPMGGEVRPENFDIVFEQSYPAGTEYKQDFKACADTTHATYMKHGFIFRDTMMTEYEINKANDASCHMGYNFQVIEVAVYNNTRLTNKVDIDVAVQQVGIAPFYYPLSLNLTCKSLKTPWTVTGVEKIIKTNDFEFFTFYGVPATVECLSQITVQLSSPMLFAENQMKFAQNNGIVSFSLPMPNNPTKPLFLKTYAPTPVPIEDIPEEALPYYVNLVMVDTITNTDIGPIFSDDPDNLDEYPSEFIDLTEVGQNISIRAVVGEASLVSFRWTVPGSNKPTVWVESVAPYSMGGDINGSYFPVAYLATPGLKKIRVTAKDLRGVVVSERDVQFTLVDSSINAANQAPIPSILSSPVTIPTSIVIIPAPVPVPAIAIIPAPVLLPAVAIVPPTPRVIVAPTPTSFFQPVPLPSNPTVIKPTSIGIIIIPQPSQAALSIPTAIAPSPTGSPPVPKPSSTIVIVPQIPPISRIVPAPPPIAVVISAPVSTLPLQPPELQQPVSVNKLLTYEPTISDEIALTFYMVNARNDMTISEITPLSTFESSSIGRSLNMVVDVKNIQVSSVVFQWKNWLGFMRSSKETRAPYALAGNFGKNYRSSSYLAYSGWKKITVNVYDTNGAKAASSTIEFDMI